VRSERIGILGLGLIGGSLALSLAGRRGGAEVWGCDRRKDHLRKALDDGAIARACPESGIASCDVVFICVPVLRSVEILRRIGGRMAPGAVLTDAGSVKAAVVKAGQGAVGQGAEFVGGHPIAGTENSGYPAASASLFEGRTVILTPTDRNTEGGLARIERIWKMTGARVLRMDPLLHDHVFAYVSHLPHAVAYALVHAVATLDSRVPLGYSAGGFRDFTRIASSDPEMWKDIVLQNRGEVLRAVGHYRKSLALLEGLIRRKDADGLLAYFRKAKKTRDRL
jgi:prephenate dehydrogenase